MALGSLSAATFGGDDVRNDVRDDVRAGRTPARARTLDALFVELYRAHFDYVWRSLARLGARDADLPDLCHDVFVVVHRKLADFDAARPAKPWLFGICYRVALDRKRKASSGERLSDDLSAERTAAFSARFAGADEVVQAKQASQLVLRALDALPDEQRAVFVLHDLDGMKVPEIQQALGDDAPPLNTLYSRIRLAREAFTAAVRALQQQVRR